MINCEAKGPTMKTLIATTAVILVMATAATASPKSCPVKTNTDGVQIIEKGCAAFAGATGATGSTGAQGDKGDRGNDGTDGTNGKDGRDGTDGTNGTNGADGTDGVDGLDGSTGATGPRGADGTDGVDGKDGATGSDGKDAVAPLGSLSFTAASESFYGDGIGFGLSNSNYGGLEGSIVFGFDLDNDWRAVAGITTDFNGKTAGSIGVGVSF